jgi:hypothetical protein
MPICPLHLQEYLEDFAHPETKKKVKGSWGSFWASIKPQQFAKEVQAGSIL